MTPLIVAIIFILLACIAALIVVIIMKSRSYKELIAKQTSEPDLRSAALIAILDDIPDIVFSKDIKKRYVYVNKAFLHFFGVTKEQVLGNLDINLPGVTKEVAQQFNRIDTYVLSQQKKSLVEESIELSETVNPTFETSKTPLIMNDELVGLIGIARDITKRKKSNELSKKHQQYLNDIKNSLAKIVTSAPILAGDYNAAADIVAKEACTILSVTRAAVWKFMPEENLLRCIAICEAGVEEPALLPDYDLNDRADRTKYRNFLYSEKIILFDADSENTLKFDDYNEDLCALMEAPIHAHDSLFGIVSIEQDFCKTHTTKRIWSFEEHAFASSLADIMALAVTGNQRNEAQKAAETANRTKSEFLSNVSHELRTPLSSIIGFADLALDSNDLSPEAREYMKKITVSTEWLSEILGDLLDISKLESEKMELEIIPFDLNKTLSNCKAMFSSQISGKNLNFYLNEGVIPENILPLGDPKKLRQVLQNLLSNAFKFTESGVITLSALVKDTFDEKLTIYFEIKDSGIGMTKEQTEKIFLPFIQAESSISRKFGGTGLGLSIASSFVHLMGGELVVESELGKGSTFMFELTFDTVSKSEYVQFTESGDTQFEHRKPIFEGEVLLCEDDEMTRDMILEHLHRVGFSVTVAENGKLGLDMALSRADSNSKQFDLILMDLHMPVMDGKEATEQLLINGIDVPIIAVTANVLTENLTIYKDDIFSDHLSKPFTSKELWRVLIKYFKPTEWQGEDEATKAGSDTSLRQKLIKVFLKDGSNKGKLIREAVESKNFILAHRLAHTLKGNAAQINAKSVQIAAYNIEKKLASGDKTVPEEMLVTLETGLNYVLREMENELIPEPERKQKSDVNAHELFDAIGNLLLDRDSACLKHVDALHSIPGSEELIEQMENFDFKLAYKTLSELRKEWSI